MRRIATFLVLTCVGVLWSAGAPVLAQQRGGGQGGGDQGDDDDRTRRRNEEWGTGTGSNLALPQLRNAGPCPYVKVLYDAGRYVELQDGRESPSAVQFSGEIQGLTSACEYKGVEPIRVQARVLFELGRGPQAAGSTKVYRYWVAVTDRDRAVLAKEYFELPVNFAPGQDRVRVTQDILGVTIPRAGSSVSGSNFEVLIGFDVTPAMAEFNRQGKRFFANAGSARQQ